MTLNDWIANGVNVYELRTFEGSSYNTCIHQKPIVELNQKVVKGQILTDATAVKHN